MTAVKLQEFYLTTLGHIKYNLINKINSVVYWGIVHILLVPTRHITIIISWCHIIDYRNVLQLVQTSGTFDNLKGSLLI